MILQLIIDTMVSGMATASVMTIINRRKNKPTTITANSLGAFPWLFVEETSTHYGGFKCPKCGATKVNNTHCTYCEEDEHYYRGHFHFDCNGCHFKCIMRTKDDKDKV